jgi:hypothetical protein
VPETNEDLGSFRHFWLVVLNTSVFPVGTVGVLAHACGVRTLAAEMKGSAKKSVRMNVSSIQINLK